MVNKDKNHIRDTKFQEALKKADDWLIRRVDENFSFKESF